MDRRVFLLSAGALALAGCGKSSSLGEVHGIKLDGAEIGKDFRLTDTEGRERTLADFKGQVVLMFFGFTQCPDVCPTTLLRAAQVREMLGEEAKRLQVLFVTVDPERDTPEVLGAYTKAFDPSFIGLYGDLERTKVTARDFKVFFQKVPTGSSYTMDHTALSYVYDAEGKLRLALRYEQTPEEFASDIRQVLNLG